MFNNAAKLTNRSKKRLRVSLRVLFLCAIPVAVAAKWYELGVNPIAYSETRSLIVRDSDVVIDFSKQPDGSAIEYREILDDKYAELGVSFASGIPSHLTEVNNDSPLIEIKYLSTDAPELASKPYYHSIYRGTRTFPRRNPDGSLIKEPQTKIEWHSKENIDEFITLGNHPLKPADGCDNEIAVTRFGNVEKDIPTPKYIPNEPFNNGIISIWFHKPKRPMELLGVYRFGFYVGDLVSPAQVEVRCYSPEGHFLARQHNISTGVVFMGFKSKRKIGWIEIEGRRYWRIGDLRFGWW